MQNSSKIDSTNFSAALKAAMVVAFVVGYCQVALAAAQLPDGTALLSADVLGKFHLDQNQSAVRMVPVVNQSFDTAVRVVVANPNPLFPWKSQLSTATAASVAKGDAILATFSMRAANPGSAARATFIFEQDGPPYRKSGAFTVFPSAEWQTVNVAFASLDDYPAGHARVNFQVGYLPQTIEIGGLSVTDYGNKVDVNDLPSTPVSYDGRNANAPWRAAAQARIDKIRKGDLTVLVTDGRGNPVANAAVAVAMTRHAFGFGSCAQEGMLASTSPNGDTYRATFTELFNKSVLESSLKWHAWAVSQQPGLQSLKWLADHHIPVRGHNLIWPGWEYMPVGVKQADYQAKLKELGRDAAKAWLLDKADAHIKDELSTLRGQCPEWDVVNEPTTNHDLEDILGPDCLVHWYQLVHQIDPAATLYVNDYDVFGESSIHTDAFYKLIDGMLNPTFALWPLHHAWRGRKRGFLAKVCTTESLGLRLQVT